ncbi:hypothetical protein BKA69DRAFT_1129176 [Paraphysoderma sedebokerense]|nr:hypothetical protein BKA69DRAFT_1129176 [Paraphysoderma sedebokerense]
MPQNTNCLPQYIQQRSKIRISLLPITQETGAATSPLMQSGLFKIPRKGFCETFLTAFFAYNGTVGDLSLNLPSIGEFIHNLVMSTRIPVTCLSLSLCYLRRLKVRHPSLSGVYGSHHRLILAAIMVASKYLYDDTYDNRTWAEVSNAFTLHQVNVMEIEFLSFLDYNLYVSATEWANLVDELDLKVAIFLQQQVSAAPHERSIQRPVGEKFAVGGLVSNDNDTLGGVSAREPTIRFGNSAQKPDWGCHVKAHYRGYDPTMDSSTHRHRTTYDLPPGLYPNRDDNAPYHLKNEGGHQFMNYSRCSITSEVYTHGGLANNFNPSLESPSKLVIPQKIDIFPTPSRTPLTHQTHTDTFDPLSEGPIILKGDQLLLPTASINTQTRVAAGGGCFAETFYPECPAISPSKNTPTPQALPSVETEFGIHHIRNIVTALSLDLRDLDGEELFTGEALLEQNKSKELHIVDMCGNSVPALIQAAFADRTGHIVGIPATLENSKRHLWGCGWGL